MAQSNWLEKILFIKMLYYIHMVYKDVGDES